MSREVVSLRLTIGRDRPDEPKLISTDTRYRWTLNDESGELALPWRQSELTELLEQLNYKRGANTDDQVRLSAVNRAGRQIAKVLNSIPPLSATLTQLEDEGSRLLHLELELEGQELASIPFELSKVPDGKDNWLTAYSGLPVVITRRHADVAPSGISWSRSPRVLFVWSEAGGSVEHKEHRLLLERALDPWRDADGELPLCELQNANVNSIQDEVAGSQPNRRFTHIHILAHGDFDELSGTDYQLALSNKSEWDRTFVDRERLANACCPGDLTKNEWPAVVTLASCESGGVRSVVDSSASIAQELHRRGIPLVVASQFKLSPEGARSLTERLYAGLHGDDPRRTLAEARNELFSTGPKTHHDWASVVCYANLPTDLPEQLAGIGDTKESVTDGPSVLDAFACSTFEQFDSGVVHCAVVTSEEEGVALNEGRRTIGLLNQTQRACGAAAQSIRALCEGYWAKRWRSNGLVREFDPNRNVVVVSEVPIVDTFKSPESLDRAIRAMCWADIVVFDVSGFEPGVMFLLGVRAAVRRGVTICSLWRENTHEEDEQGNERRTNDSTDWMPAVPFNIQNLTWSERRKQDSGSYQRTLIDLMKIGLKELDELPHYLDLPAFGALRNLGTAAESARTIPRDEKVLVLCPFDPTYTDRNFQDYLRPELGTVLGEDSTIERLGDDKSPRLVSQKLYEAIRRTEMCIVDWTCYRPNVFMELGVRLATSKLGAIQILEEPDDALPAPPRLARVPCHLADMTAIFRPLRYSCTAGQTDAYQEMVRAFDARRERPDHDHLYQTVLDAIDGSDPGHEPVYAGLARAADLLQAPDESRKGFTQVLFVENRAMRQDAEAAARELRIAAWLYLEHRVQVEGSSDPALLKEYKALGDLVAGKLNSRRASDADKVLARYIYDRVRKLYATEEGDLDVDAGEGAGG